MADRMMVGRSISMSSLAIYQLAASGMAPLAILMGSINSAYLPYYYEQRNRGDAVRAKLVAIDSLIIAGLAGISLATIAVVPELIHILAPPSYAAAAALASWFVLTAFFGGLTLQFTKELLFLKRPELASVITLVPSMLGVAANLFVIPRFGAVGATMVAVAVNAAIFIVTIVVTRRIDDSRHNLGRIGAVCVLVSGFCMAFAGRHFVPFGRISLGTRLLAALLCFGGAVLILSGRAAWRQATGAPVRA
jgi:O-antigen/teichoic acid export membrane protein